MVFREKLRDGTTKLSGGALAAWPVNSVHISFDNVNPSTYFGGTWSAIGQGKMLVGVDSSDAAMDAAGDTGGTKTNTLTEANLPPHDHAIDHNHAQFSTSSLGGHTHELPFKYLATTTTTGTALRVTDIQGQDGGTGTNATATANSTGSGHSHDIDPPAYSGQSGNGDGTSTPVNNLPPYLAVYMWRRTA